MDWQSILNNANTALANTQNTANSVQQSVDASNAAFQELLNRQGKEQQGYFDLYKNTIANQEALPVLYQRLGNELGVNDLQGTVQGYKDQINKVQQLLGNLDANLASRTKGTNTTQAQLDRLVAFEGAPLRTQLSNLGYALQPAADLLSSAQGTLGTLLNLNVEQQNKELKPIEMQISATSDRFAREITGFTEQRQATLDVLMDKLNRERTLADREWQLAQDLAAEERDYARQKSLASTNLSQYLGDNTTTNTTTKSAADWGNLLQGGSSINLSVQPAGGIKLQSPGGSLNQSGRGVIPLGTSTGGFSLQGGGGLRLQ